MSKRDSDPLIIDALARGLGHRQAARYAGVCTKTVQRRLQEPGFCLQLHDRKAQVTAERAAERAAALGGAATEAVDVLLEIMESSTDDRLRAQCAMDILDRAGLTKPEPAKKSRPLLPEAARQQSVLEQVDEIAHNMRLARTADIPGRWTKVDKAQVRESTPAEPAPWPPGFDPGATPEPPAPKPGPGQPPDWRKLPYRQHFLID